MKEVTNWRGKSPKKLPVTMNGPYVAVDILHVEEKEKKINIIVQSSKIVDFIGNAYPTKESENKALGLYGETDEHPYQAVVLAVGPESGILKIGDIIYCSVGLLITRSNIQYNGNLFPVIGLGSVICVAGNINID